MLLVANLTNTKHDETLAHGYSTERAHKEPSKVMNTKMTGFRRFYYTLYFLVICDVVSALKELNSDDVT